MRPRFATLPRDTSNNCGLHATREELAIYIPTANTLWRLTCISALCLLTATLHADPVAVRNPEGTLHGFLTARTDDGKIIAAGDIYETAHGDRIATRLVFHFKDGSVDDETTVFTQRKVFHLISDHHIQRGPFFPHPIDLSLDASGQVTVRFTDKDGKEKVDTEHMNLPTDLANGLTFIISKNILPQSAPVTVSMIAVTPKPRLVKIVLTPREQAPFTLAGVPHQAMRFEVKVELGGVAGVVAPLIGKQPGNFDIWVLGGQAPTIVKAHGFLYEGAPALTFELTSPVWPPDAASTKEKSAR